MIGIVIGINSAQEQDGFSSRDDCLVAQQGAV